MKKEKAVTASLRAPRSDARENRARILDAARARFAADGQNADMDAIAQAAGVAVGTLYHHFGTKDALLEATVLDNLQDIQDYLRALLSERDAWTAVEKLVTFFAQRQYDDRAFRVLIGARPELRAATTATKKNLGPLMAQILERAQRAGKLRADVVPADIPHLLDGLAVNELSPAARKRYLEIILQGLKT